MARAMLQVQWTGLNEFQRELQHLPEHLANEASAIVLSSAQGAQQTIQANYPTGPTGNLKRLVFLNRNLAQAVARAVVKSAAPHAVIFEKGTRVRRTRQGANRGAMPAAPEVQRFIPTAARFRARMVTGLRAMLEREGFLVKG